MASVAREIFEITMANETAIEMFVGGLMLDPNTQAPVVVLKDESGDIVLPIWIGIAEATSIASVIKQVPMTRPLTHDLMRDIISELGVKIERVVITDLKDSTYFSELVLSVGEKALVFDARPSDAIAIALRASAPIYVTQQVLDQARVAFSQQGQGAGGAKKDPKGEQETDLNLDDVEGETQPGDIALEGNEVGNLTNIDKDKWTEILSNLDPEDFKYKQ